MAISVDFGASIIYVNKVDMVLIQSVPTEIYQLDMNGFRQDLKELEDDETGMAYTDTHSHNPPVTISGAVLARVVEILAPYTVTFEDGQYRVNVVGANTNIGERINVNQVSVSTSNSAGLQDLNSLQAASYSGEVSIDVNSNFSGTTFPIGTAGNPVNNMADAHAIGQARGISTFRIVSSMTLTSEDLSDSHNFVGTSAVSVVLTIDTGANVSNCTFTNLTIQGVLDNNNVIRDCAILDLTHTNGFLHQCALAGKITLGGAAQATIMSCYSGVAGGGNTAEVDMGGSGQSLVMRDYSGGITISNKTGTDAVSIDMSSGQIILESTVSDGSITCRGVAKLVDKSTGTATVDYTGLIVGTATIPAIGKVILDESSSATGLYYPVGTEFSPVNNFSDAIALCLKHGVSIISVNGSATTGATDVLDNLEVQGFNTKLTITSGTSTSKTSFRNLKLQGALSGPIKFHEGQLLNVTGLTGHCHTVLLTDATFALASGSMYFIDCFSGVVGSGQPDVDMNGSGASLGIRGYSGGVNILNKTGADEVSIDMNSGHVKLDSTITAGDIIVRGQGKITDNSTGTAVVDQLNLITGDKFINIEHKVESQNSQTSKFGDVFYVDPINGNNNNPGSDPNRAYATVANALTKTTPNNGDVIYVISPGSASIVLDEVINLNVADVALRAENSGVIIQSSVAGSPAITISADSVNVQNFTIKTAAGGTDNAIDITNADNVVLDTIRIESPTGKGIDVTGTDFLSIIDSYVGYCADGGIELTNCYDTTVSGSRIIHNTGNAVSVQGSTEHTKLDDCHLTSSLSCLVINTTGHETSVAGNTVIHGSGQYGIDVQNNSEGVHILGDTTIYGCTLGNINDNGSNTYNESDTVTNANIAAEILNSNIADHVIAGSLGELNRQMAFSEHIHVDSTGVAGTAYPLGTSNHPVSNIADALTIAATVGVTRLQIGEDITIGATDDVSGFEISGSHSLKSEITVTSGAATTFTHFSNCNLIGTLSGDAVIHKCTVGDLAGFSGIITSSTFTGTLSLAGNKVVHILDSSSGVPGTNTPTIDLGGSGIPLTIRNYNGGIKLENRTGTDAISIDMASGQVIADGTVSAGEITVRGSAKVTDNSTGTAVINDDTDTKIGKDNTGLNSAILGNIL